MDGTRAVGGIVRAAIDAGLMVSAGCEVLLATPGRRKRLKEKLARRKAIGLTSEATEAMKIRGERERLWAEGEALGKHMACRISEQQRDNPLNPAKQTIFLIVTSGQAIRSFLLSDVFDQLAARFNVVVITQYACDASFVRAYQHRDVHVLPWLTRFKSRFTNLFQYHLIQTSGSPTHKGWLKNLDARAKEYTEGDADYRRRKRFRYHVRARQLSTVLGRFVGAKGLIELY